ncbi:hypothetical protein CDL12_04412 [Handroanthus impetiginosus]|uniref:Retrovirus-related Pol polyprotein from transposon TNT 1-94-like beta-barrel domain-containing protein n=1 Tax=Handroanthus impetiginosus TaxID=429701 RepID=A0A2G9HZE0_9LAMI|nr:hypothetical protein CDL12_04412 [Handroanthus impetiginosus]
MNFNISKLDMTVNDLVNMLTMTESIMKKNKTVLVVSTSKAQKGKVGKKKKSSSKGKQTPKLLGWIKKNANTKENKYFYCGEIRHEKRNCKKYLASLKNGIFFAKVNFSINSDICVFDTACGSHLYESLQGVLKAKKLSKGDVIFRMKNGGKIDVKASGLITLACNNPKLELNDCLSIPSFLKNIISIPVLDKKL